MNKNESIFSESVATYETPEFEIITLTSDDVVTSSPLLCEGIDLPLIDF